MLNLKKHALGLCVQVLKINSINVGEENLACEVDEKRNNVLLGSATLEATFTLCHRHQTVRGQGFGD